MARNLAFLRGNYSEHTVNGKVLKFYPLSISALHTLKAIAGPLASALGVLFAKDTNDHAKQVETFVGQVEKMSSDKTIISATPIDTIKYRAMERATAINKLVDALTNDETHTALIKVVLSSLRDDYAAFTDADVIDVKKATDIPTLIELYKGVVQANAGAFGPLVQKVTDALRDQTSATLPPQASPASSTQGAESKAANVPTLVR